MYYRKILALSFSRTVVFVRLILSINSIILYLLIFYDKQASEAARTVSADITGNSVSFNEYLKLVSNERKSEPDEDALLNMFR